MFEKNEDLARRLFEKFMDSRGERKYEPVGPLSPELNAEMLAIKNERMLVENKCKQLDARRDLLWTQIEAETGIYDRDLKYDAGLILSEVKEENLKEKPTEE